MVFGSSLALVLWAIRSAPAPAPPVLVNVVVSSPGRSASELELLVAEPLEDQLAGTPSLRSLQTWNTEGLVLVKCGFDGASDPFEAASLVRDRVRAEQLPNDVETPMIGLATGRVELARYELVSDSLPLVELLTMHDERLRGELLSMPGVERLEVCGSGEPEVRVELDSRRLEAYGIRAEQLRTEVERWSLLGNPGGRAKIEELGELVVGQAQERPIRLNDIASIRTSTSPHGCSCLVDGKPSLCASVYGRKDAGADAVVARVRQWAASAPPGLRVRAEVMSESTVRFGLWASDDTPPEIVPKTAKLVAHAAQPLSDAPCRVTLGGDSVRASLDGPTGELSFATTSVPAADFELRVKQALESAIPGLRVAVHGRDAWEFVVRGPDREELVPVAEALRKGVDAREGVFQALLVGAGQRPSFEVRIKRERAGDLGIMPRDVMFAARLAMDGELLRAGRPRIRLGWAGEDRSIEQLMNVRLPSAAGGGSVPLGEIAEVRVQGLADPIVREDRERVVYVRVWAVRGAPESWAEGVGEVASGIPLPAGVTVAWRRVVDP